MELTEILKILAVVLMFALSVFGIVLVSKKPGKYNLIKISGIVMLLAVVLSWIVKFGYFYGTELVGDELNRIGLTNVMQYGLMTVRYFAEIVTFLFVLGGLYQVLSKRPGYQAVVNGIANKLKGKEAVVVVCVSFVMAILASMMNEYLPILLFVPFVIAIFNRLKIDKMVAYSSTFGSILVGTFGSIYSNKVAGIVNGTFVDSYIWVKIILFAVAFIGLNVFAALRMKKTKRNDFKEYDMFNSDKLVESKKTRKWPYIVGIALVFVTTVMAYLPWSTWGVTVFDTATEWVNTFSIGGIPIFGYLLGTLVSFGNWDLFTVQFVMIFAILLIHWIGRIKLDDLFESLGEGFRKLMNTIGVALVIYLILVLSATYLVTPTIVNFIAGLSNGFNIVYAWISAFITSIFGVEMDYVSRLTGTFFAAQYTARLDILAIIYQSAYGLASFFVPSSAALMIGLSYMDIPYKDWFKYIWKFLIAMFVAIAVIIAVMQLFVLN